MLYKETSFDQQDQITEKLRKHFLQPKYFETKSSLYSAKLTFEEVDAIVPELMEQFQKLNLTYDLFRTFVTAAKSATGIHTDGTLDDPKYFALNWPVYNCNHSHMLWYQLPEDAKSINVPDVPYSVINYSNANARVIKKIILKQPTWVRVDVPHNVYNYSKANRLILSFRFKPEPFWLFK